MWQRGAQEGSKETKISLCIWGKMSIRGQKGSTRLPFLCVCVCRCTLWTIQMPSTVSTALTRPSWRTRWWRGWPSSWPRSVPPWKSILLSDTEGEAATVQMLPRSVSVFLCSPLYMYLPSCLQGVQGQCHPGPAGSGQTGRVQGWWPHHGRGEFTRNQHHILVTCSLISFCSD